MPLGDRAVGAQREHAEMFISGAASGAARVESLEPRRLLSSAHILKDISPAGLDPQHITTIGSRVFFDTTARGKTELWTSDGTSKGTKSLHTFGSDTTSGGYL